MGNQLFQHAREFVEQAIQAGDTADQQEKLEVAKNALSSAYANSTTAEKAQLAEFQQQLEDASLESKS
ncbi:DUF3813 domain-containing protein [Peribacillus cavernae]|uniref:DUF3813 domain-containing protein n=1 Tax=Peribacillus cavernae TaxID=1674310 RepID=A0A433HP68_9BACI|nr:DUF3813 domain-containing protein [Peribacillus cavernae]MDQ0217553.1 hypothetical protein [Peribacillus cavernae]RUQ30012.1 DUF3813 domain-containing protein [Peribacillus cavernae]